MKIIQQKTGWSTQKNGSSFQSGSRSFISEFLRSKIKPLLNPFFFLAGEYTNSRRNCRGDEKKSKRREIFNICPMEKKEKFQIIFKVDPEPNLIDQKEQQLKLPFLKIGSEEVLSDFVSNSRCVPVGTKMNAPGGRKKKEMFKAKRIFVKIRCSVYEKKLLQVKAKRSGLSLSEFIRRVAMEKDIKERLSEDHVDIYKSLVKFHNNFKWIGNMFRKKDPKLSETVYKIAEEIKIHLQKVEK